MNEYLDYGDKIYRLACELYELKRKNKRTYKEWECYLRKQVEYAELMYGYNSYMLKQYEHKHCDNQKEFEFQANAAKEMLLDYRDQYLDFIESIKKEKV